MPRLHVTKSVDGKLRANLRLEIRVGLDELSTVLCYKFRGEDVDTLDEGISRANILRMAREESIAHGRESIGFWADGVDDPDDVERLYKWATSVVLRAFPEFGERP